MTWKEVEGMFNRALAWSFSRKKLTFAVPVLLFCGLMTGGFQVWGSKVGDWQGISMLFLPIFFSASVLLSCGVVLIRVYHHEVKGLKVSYRNTLQISKQLMVEIAYLAVPAILIYLVLWTLLGLFYLFKELPLVGEVLGLILSFGPFLLLMGSFALTLSSLLALFFATPLVAFRSSVQWDVLKQVFSRVKFNPFSNLILFFLSVLPLTVVTGLMLGAAFLTSKTYLSLDHPVARGIQWFFMMLPSSVLLAPAVIFFFNFAAEAHVLMVRRQKEVACALP